MAWTVEDLTWLGIDEAASGGDVITITLGTPVGPLQSMADVALEVAAGRNVLVLKGAHVQSEAGPNAFGLPNLRVLIEFLLQEVDCDEARIEGATRTTGANPGHTPRPLRFTRRGDTSRGG